MVVKVCFAIERDHGEWKICVFVGTIELAGFFIDIPSMNLANVSDGLYAFSTKNVQSWGKVIGQHQFLIMKYIKYWSF